MGFGLVILMCCCGFINCNKYTTVGGNVDKGRDYACVAEAGGIWEISVPSLQFYCELNTDLKNCHKNGALYSMLII